MILIIVVMAAPSMYWSLQSHDVWVYFDYYDLLLLLLYYYYMIHPWHDPCTLWHDPSMTWSMHICDYRCGGWSLAVLQTSLKTWWLPNIKSTGLQWWHGYGENFLPSFDQRRVCKMWDDSHCPKTGANGHHITGTPNNFRIVGYLLSLYLLLHVYRN